LHEQTTAWLTYPVRRIYLLPVVVEGALDVASTKRLIASYNKYAPTEAMLKAGDGACQKRRAGTGAVAWTRPGGSVDELEVGAWRRAETTSIASVAQHGQD